jgi:nucleotide-binding universal stress UspA family protein
MRILLASDFSPYAEMAHVLVRNMRLPEGSRIRLVHAIEPITSVALFAPSAILSITEAAEADARAQVSAVAKTLVRAGVQADGVIGYGRAADVVIDECASFQPDLLVVGSRGRGGIATSVLGSVSAELVDRAPCPVLVARKSTLSTVVMAEDGSPTAAAGARVIAELPPFAAARVHVVSVVDVPFPIVNTDPTGSAAALDAYRAYQDSLPTLRASHEALARERAQAFELLGIHASSEQREGDAAYELIAAAKEKDADCIVVGSRGQTGLRRLVLGSVARGVLFHSACSVLIAHTTKPIDATPVASGDGRLAGAGATKGV